MSFIKRDINGRQNRDTNIHGIQLCDIQWHKAIINLMRISPTFLYCRWPGVLVCQVYDACAISKLTLTLHSAEPLF